jgi:Protein of unknown function (DUF3572)
MTSYRKMTAEEAELVAVSAFAFVAGDPERLARFLEITGLRPETIRQAAASPGFYGAVLDHVAADEQLLLALAGALGTKPERIMQARHTLAPSDFE